MPLRLAELRRNTDNIVEVKVGLRRALEKCFEGFFCDRHRELPQINGKRRLQMALLLSTGGDSGFYRGNVDFKSESKVGSIGWGNAGLLIAQTPNGS